METMLNNSADIQAKEDKENRLYDRVDVETTMDHLTVVDPFTETPIGQRHNYATAEFLPNGHVMGANSIFVRLEEQNILFTGDIGKPQQSLCGGYLDYAPNYPNDPVHVLVVESTNFNNEPVSFEEKRRNFLSSIQNTWKNGGNPLLPVLSFHRFHEILEMLHNSQGHEIPEDCKIFIDAPLGMNLLDDFKKLTPDQLTSRYGNDPDYYKTEEESLNRFDLKNLTVVNSHVESIANDAELASYPGKAIIIASGGMAEHGRSLNYIHGQFCQNSKNTVIFTCHQVEGTEGAALLKGEAAKGSKKKGAKHIYVKGFTGHVSGPTETFDFLNRFNLGQLKDVIVTHGNDLARLGMVSEFKTRHPNANVFLPKLEENIEI